MMRLIVSLLMACLASTANGYAAATPLRATVSSASRAAVSMGPAKDGPFTPLVLGAKVVLGEPLLLKLRGKAISYHSQYINDFCKEYGVPKKLNQGLIKKAKAVGSDLGFLS